MRACVRVCVRACAQLFATIKRVSGTNRLTELKPARDARQKPILYGIDPATRYVHLPRALPPAGY